MIVVFGLKIVVPTPLLASTVLSQALLAVVSVSVWETVPFEIVIIGAVAQVVVFCDCTVMRVMFVALCVAKLHIL